MWLKCYHDKLAQHSTTAFNHCREQSKVTILLEERLSTTTVGLVALSDFRKRRAEVLEQQEREAREARKAEAAAAAGGTSTGTGTPVVDRSQAGTPDNAAAGEGGGSAAAAAAGGTAAALGAGFLRPTKRMKRKKKAGRKLLSFGDDDDEEDNEEDGNGGSGHDHDRSKDGDKEEEGEGKEEEEEVGASKIRANASVGLAPRSVTKSALRREAAEREALRREFLALQEAVKATEVAVPFVFYDGANTPGGTVRMKKGDFVWAFLDRSRKVGARRKVGERSSKATRAWARVGVDDLMLVRGTVIIPHHYDFYYFVINKSVGPGGKRIFDYSAEAPDKTDSEGGGVGDGVTEAMLAGGLSTAAEMKAARKVADVSTLEGADEDPLETKVVDRRWYKRNKHIYPASTWQEFDPETDYAGQVRKDVGGNTFFYSK